MAAPILLRLYNTLGRKVEVFKPIKKSSVGLYTCGPTVYNHVHIGNLRSYIFSDTLYRTLQFNGYKTRWVMNITDVDDKTIRSTLADFGADATPRELRTFTDRYTESFKKDIRALNVAEPSIRFIQVSDAIPEIVSFIKKLLRKGYAYRTEDGVYFNIAEYQKDFKDYGALVGKDFLRGKKVGARVRVDEYTKEDLSDFALWKSKGAESGNIFWEDEVLGAGRPGWHIECSVINYKAFKGTTDLHTGGVDLIFPHHTNEIAQSQPLYHPFVRYWSHCEHLLVDSAKMAKSAGNFYTLDDIKKRGISPLAFRYLALGAHYRSRLNFTWESLEAAANNLRKIGERYRELSAEKSVSRTLAKTRDYEADFTNALNEDLNTPKALAVLHILLKDKTLAARAKVNLTDRFDRVLGLGFAEMASKTEAIPAEVRELARKREEYRRSEQFTQADRLRNEIDELGYEVEDTGAGPVVRKKS